MSVRQKLLTASMAVVLSATAAAPAFAQIPPDLRDLVGARAGQAELEVQRRGYRAVRTQEGGSAKWTYWRRGDECVQITTRDGRYLTMTNASLSSCGGSSSGSSAATAAIAGVAIIGLAAALAAHNRDHQNSDRAHDDEYQRGYQAAFDGASYDARRETEGYHEGYLAGESERDNRRYADTPLVRNAPRAAQSACSRRADEFMNRPYGSSVPISAREVGRGDYELTMATGSYRSRCTVSSNGAVRAMNPY